MFIFIFLFVHSIFVEGLIILPLSKYTWTVENPDGLVEKNILTKIPTGIYSDLFPDNFFNIIYSTDELNNEKYQWVANTEWIYSVQFPVEENIFNAPNVELVFHGLDGTTTIYFNNREIGKTTNSFVRYRFDVKSLLRREFNNNLKIVFDSPLKTASKMATEFKDFTPDENNENNVHFLRRMQASFGTDWSPALPSIGIWKEIELIAYENGIKIRDIDTEFYGNLKYLIGNLEINVYCDIPLNIEHDINGNIESVLLTGNNQSKSSSKGINITPNLQEDRTLKITMTIPIRPEDAYQLWWPNEYGEQNLYELKVTAYNDFGKITDKKIIKIGFRSIELNRDMLHFKDTIGQSFSFRINGFPIYAKGANFLPVDILPEKSSNKEIIKSLLLAAKMAHMNMLRVPAVGIYQSDYFYELCDEYGILIWQDMMFYKEMYPMTSEDAVSSVTTEITQQVMRLKYHPSVALWVLSSDILVTINKIRETDKGNVAVKTFLKYCQTALKKLQPFHNILYLISTPSQGEKECYSDIKYYSDPNTIKEGDTHMFLNGNSWLSTYNPKFVSVFGIRSFPSLDTLKRASATDNNDLSSIYTNFMKHRQHRDKGDINTEILCSIAYHFGIPKAEDLDNLIYASQINQAWSLKVHIDKFRGWRMLYSRTSGNGLTNGILIWHLNDVWTAPTFSSIVSIDYCHHGNNFTEYGGKWKMLQYYAHKFFNPVSSHIIINDDKDVDVYLFSDLKNNISINIKMEIFKWTLQEPVHSDIKESILIQNDYIITTFHGRSIFEKECNFYGIDTECLLKITFISADNQEIHQNFLLPETYSFKDIVDLPNPKVEVTVESCSTEKCIILVKADAIALFVWLDIDNVAGYFSDNGFIMTEKEKIIEFFPLKEIPGDDLLKLISPSVKVMDKNRLDQFDYPPDDFKTNLCKDY